MRTSLSISLLAWVATLVAVRGMGLTERVSVRHEALLEDRRERLPALSDPFGVPEPARVVLEPEASPFPSLAAWRGNVVATVFWVGEEATLNNPISNVASAWDPNWTANFGGLDDPQRREGFRPAGFEPRLNAFYVALPYNDLGSDGRHRPEAAEVIPWFWREYRGEGVSVCRGRWVAIHCRGRVCYAQWEDVGPFQTDHWQYVFGGEEPRDNRNGGAGIDVSPAVRDFLQLRSGERVQWRFLESRDVPSGPWLTAAPP
ncbi:hypothetical protein HNR46_003642 [Haloferula luteola]|uniref:Uncharacterized protein n=1 Tax=Haloferula luteola TaxID=595692 RepID=A0A840V5U3_9BACT|nr:hypothetical protein [Haloferula luteola]MBB5353385.1 hypothetical protein [Haloferula luteola]